MSYISRTTWSLWLFIFAVLLACGWLFFDSREYNHRRYVEQTLEGIAKLRASSIETWRDGRLRDAEMLSLNPVLRDALLTLGTVHPLRPDHREVLIQEVRQQMLPLQLAYEYKNIRIISRDNSLTIALSDDSRPQSNPHMKQSVERAWLDRAPILSDVHLNDDNTPVMDVIVPLFLDEEAEKLGLALNLVIDPRLDFYPSLQDIPIPSKTYEALLVRQEVDQIRFITPLRHLDAPPLSQILPMDSPDLPAALGLKGREGVVAGHDYRGVSVLAVSTKVRDTPWVLIVKMDTMEALRVQYRETQFVAVGAVVVAVAVLALVFLAKAQAKLTESVAVQRAQAETLAQETRIASIMRAAPVGVGIARAHRLIEVNETFCGQISYEYDELIGRSARQLFPTQEAFDAVVPAADEAMKQTGRYSCEGQMLRRDGTTFSALINTAYIATTEGAGDVCFTVMDISERKAQEERLSVRTAELERSNADLTTFAYVASHDLRSPLRGISQLSEWVRQDMPDTVSDEIKSYLDLMGNRIQRMENLLDDLLEYSRVGRIEGDIEEVSIEAICNESFDLQQPPENFSLRIKGDLPTFMTLGTPLRLIFRNLISNAIKHGVKNEDSASGVAADECWVEIRAIEDNSKYRFFVADNGPGIEPEYHDRIFALFQTLRPRDEVEGSGMGLAIIRRVLEAYDSRIQVVSDGVNGTEFVFTWPKETKLRRLLDVRKHG